MAKIIYAFPLLVIVILFVSDYNINKELTGERETLITAEQEYIINLANEISKIEPKDWKEKESIDSFEYLFGRLNQSLEYQRIFIEDWRYLNKTSTRIIISEEKNCWNDGDRHFCVSGQFSCGNSFGTDDRWIKILITIPDTEDELIFTFLHEMGHLIQYAYSKESLVNDCYGEVINSTDNEWKQIHNEVIDPTLRDYGKSSPEEDFADSYARYRLGREMPRQKIDFIKEVERKAGVVR